MWRKIFFICGFVLFTSQVRGSDDVYDVLSGIFSRYPSLSECDCMEAITRGNDLSSTLRGVLDQEAVRWLCEDGKKRLNLLFFASGMLKNETTILAHLMKSGCSVNVFLVDTSYDSATKFEGERAIHAENAQKALRDFHQVVMDLSQVYSVESRVNAFFEVSDAMSFILKNELCLDGFFVIDCFFPSSFAIERLRDLLLRVSFRDKVLESILFLLNKKYDNVPNGKKAAAVLDIFRCTIRENEFDPYCHLLQNTIPAGH